MDLNNNQHQLKRQSSTSSSSISSRPVSRRGGGGGGGDTIYEDFTLGTSSPIMSELRPGTGLNRIPTSGRPPTSSLLRGGGTASRLSTAIALGGASVNGMPSHRIGTALGYAGNMILERPLTQHGISGLSTANTSLASSQATRIGTASSMRQIKDKRYWQGQLQMKMNEISREIERLIKEKETMDREQSARRTFEKKVKEATKELSNHQSKLTDMNIALDSHSTGITRQQLQKETMVMRESNENYQSQLEHLFGERQVKEELNEKCENEIKIEKNKLTDIVKSLSEHDQQQYHALQLKLEDLRHSNTKIHEELDAVQQQKERLEQIVQTSTARVEAVRLLTKLNELVVKRNQLREDEANRLTPAQEREKLITDVRANNQALQQIGRQMKLIEDQLNEKRQQLQQIDQDLDEGASDRHAKYKELKRRDDTMNKFMETFTQDMINEKQNIETLKNQITYAIEQITLQGLNLKSFGLTTKGRNFDENNDLNSHDGLIREYKKLSIQLKQLQLLEQRTREQFENLTLEERQIMENIEKYTNLDALRTEASMKTDELSMQMEELTNKKRITEAVVEEAKKSYESVKEELRSNDTYRHISHLEEKLMDLFKENKILQESLDQFKQEFDYTNIKKQSEVKLYDLMEMLRNDMN